MDLHEPRQHYGLTLAILTMAATAYALQQTMVVPALPELQRELGASTTWVTWVMTGFLLSAAVLTPILGKLGDRYGKERLLVLSLVIFLVGCIGCAAAPDIWTLILFRIVSGAAGAVFPLSFGIIRDEFPPDRMKVGIGLLSAVFGVGGGLGLVLSGVIVDNTSWRWLFVVGAFGVAIAIVLVRRFVPESPVRSTSRIDVPGAALMSVVLVSFLLALSEGESWGWTSPAVLGLFALSAVGAVLWVVLELHVDEPLIDIRVLSERPVLLTNITALISGFAMFGSFVLVPRFVEAPGGLPEPIASQLDYGFGATATMTGLYLLPGSILMLGAGPSAGLLGRRFGSKWPLALGMALIAVSTFGLASLHSEPWEIVLSMAGLSVGVGFAFAAMAALITEAVDPDRDGDRDGHQHRHAHGGLRGGRAGRRRDPHRDDASRDGRPDRGRLRQRVSPVRGRRRDRLGDRRVRDAAAAPAPCGAGGRGGVTVATSDAQVLADAVEGLLAALVRHGRSTRDPEPGELSTFQSLALAAIVDLGAVRLGSLADALGTTDATASRTVDVLELHGFAARRPDTGDGRGVLVEPTAPGRVEVRRRRRRLTRLAERALGDLGPAEASRVTAALVELRVLLDRG